MSQRDRPAAKRASGATPSPANRRSNTALSSTPTSQGLLKSINLLLANELIPDDNINIEYMVTGLQHLANKSKSVVITECITAFAAYAQAISLSAATASLSAAVMESVSESLQPHLEQLEDANTALQNAAQSVANSEEQMTKLGEEAEVRNQDLNAHVAKLQEQINRMENLPRGPPTLSEPTHPSGFATTRNAPPRSYAAVTQHLPSTHNKVVANEREKTKRITICGTKEQPLGVEDLSEEVLLTKANTAIDIMRQRDPDIPEDIRFMAARKDRNGNVTYELESPAAAWWLSSPLASKDFLRSFGGHAATIRSPTYATIAEFVPTSVDLEDPNFASTTCDRNNMQDNAIKNASWLKKIERRRIGQLVAMLRIDFATAGAANFAIENGLILKGKRVTVRKFESEPTRCNKCHRYDGHFATQCRQDHEICATCGEHDHVSKDCTQTNPANFRCVNCNCSGHRSTDRTCPSYQESRRQRQARITHSNYKFYPTEDPDSWELANRQPPFNPSFSPRQHRTLPDTAVNEAIDIDHAFQIAGPKQTQRQKKTTDFRSPTGMKQTTITGFATTSRPTRPRADTNTSTISSPPTTVIDV